MKRTLLIFLMGAGLMAMSQHVAGQGMDEAEMMKAWQNFMTPGPMHQMMAKWAGEWEAEVLTFMDPSAPPIKSTATSTQESMMNGLYLKSRLSGNMMGMPFEGMGIMGYDNAKKVFVDSWVDNMGSGIIYMTGHWDAETHTLHLNGMQTDPMTGKDATIRQEIQIEDDNTQVMTMYGQGPDGKEIKFMQATMKRKM